jgi:hypothetical protein
MKNGRRGQVRVGAVNAESAEPGGQFYAEHALAQRTDNEAHYQENKEDNKNTDYNRKRTAQTALLLRH